MIITEDDEVGSGLEQGIFSLIKLIPLNWIEFVGLSGVRGWRICRERRGVFIGDGQLVQFVSCLLLRWIFIPLTLMLLLPPLPHLDGFLFNKVFHCIYTLLSMIWNWL